MISRLHSFWQDRTTGWRLPRAEGISDRQVVLAFGARFWDELLSGMPDVLMPTLQQQLGLSLAQVSLLRQLLDYVALVVEPVSGLLIDVWPRRWLMALGAVGISLSVILIGIAPTLGLLLLAYALFGAASGPLAHTGDVVIVEAYPTVPDRAFTRSTMIDTVGALLGPLLVAAVFWWDLSWRGLLVAAGLVGILYGLALWRVGFPPPAQAGPRDEGSLWETIGTNVRVALADGEARRWLLFLFCFHLLETPFLLKSIWLVQEVGMSQAWVGVYVAVEMAVGLLGLVVLDRWRRKSTVGHVLRVITLAVALVFPLWLLLPGVWTRFLLMIPLAFVFAMYWPLAKASSLAAVPGRAGVMQAVSSLFGLLPLPLLFGLLAQAMGLTWAMLTAFCLSWCGIAVLVFVRHGR